MCSLMLHRCGNTKAELCDEYRRMHAEAQQLRMDGRPYRAQILNSEAYAHYVATTRQSRRPEGCCFPPREEESCAR